AAAKRAAGHLAAVDRRLAVRRGVEPYDDAQCRDLAEAVWSEQCVDLAVVYGEADAVGRLLDLHGAVDAQREALGDVDKADLTHCALSSTAASARPVIPRSWRNPRPPALPRGSR